MGRTNTLLPDLHTKAVMEAEGPALRDAGLFWRKIEYAKGWQKLNLLALSVLIAANRFSRQASGGDLSSDRAGPDAAPGWHAWVKRDLVGGIITAAKRLLPP